MINGKEVKTLIDSGAAANIITNKLRKRLGIRIERPSKTVFTIANGKKIPSLGETEITIEINEQIRIPVKVQIIDSEKKDLILGTTFLMSTKGIINFEEKKLIELLIKYEKLCALSTTKLGKTGIIKHKINTGENKPIISKPYKTNDEKKEIIRNEIEKMEKSGIIKRSYSPWALPVVIVDK